MTLSILTPRAGYTGDGLSNTYSVPFPFLANSEVRVVVEDLLGNRTLLALNTDYTISGAGGASGGSIVLVNAAQSWLSGGNLILNYILAIRRAQPLTQPSDIRNLDRLYLDTIETQFDRHAMQAQMLQESIDRCLQLPETETGTAAKTVLPNAAARAGGYLGFDASGNVAIVAGTTGGLLVVDGANALAQRNGVNAQSFRVYNTYTDASNYERAQIAWSANVLRVGTQKAGTGVNRAMIFTVGNTDCWSIDTSGYFVAATDNVFDIGATASGRPRTIYWGTQAVGPVGAVGTPTFSFAGDLTTGVYHAASGNVAIAISGALKFAVDNSFTYLRDNTILFDTASTARLRGASATIWQSNGANAQAFNLYNTTDSDATPVNYERMSWSWVANTAQLLTQAGGTGSIRNMRIGVSGANGLFFNTSSLDRLQINASGHMLWSTDNTLDIGASAASRPRSMYWGTQLLGPDGNSTNPAFSFASQTNTGMYRVSDGIYFAFNGAANLRVGTNVVQLATAGALQWGTGDSGSAADTFVVRDAANVVAQKNGVTAQESRIYGTTTGPHYVGLKHSGTVAMLYTNTTDDLAFAVNGTTAFWKLGGSTGHFLAQTDNTNDIGAAGATRARTIYVGTSVVCPSYLGASDNTATVGTAATRMATVSTGIGGHLVYAAASDANPTTRIVSGSIGFGAGGASAVDMTFSRSPSAGMAYFSASIAGTLTSSPAEHYVIAMSQQFNGAFTITRMVYLQLAQSSGAAAITDACALGFDAAVGTHKALASPGAVAVTLGTGPTGANAGNPLGWIKMNINGTVRFTPFW